TSDLPLPTDGSSVPGGRAVKRVRCSHCAPSFNAEACVAAKDAPLRSRSTTSRMEIAMTEMMKVGLFGLGLATALALSLPASAEDYGPFKEMDTSAGEVLVDAKGMTLYTFDKDEAGKSNCNGDCAKAWPPAMAMESDKPTGDLTIIKRDDGSLQ